mgnify:FL=1
MRVGGIMEIKLSSYFEQMASQDRISHAFLVCNTEYSVIKDELSLLFNHYFFEESVDIDNCSDVVIVNPENDKIVKEQILELQDKLKSYSQTHKNRVYIINDAHKMNDYAANSLLKFLEEPESNIYAFLITTNINKILPTIKSRCQVLSIQNMKVFDIKSYSNEVILKTIQLIRLMEEKKSSSFGYLYDIISKKEEKDNVINMLKIMKYFYSDVFNLILSRDIIYFEEYLSDLKYVGDLNSKKDIIRKMLILSKSENKLEYNLNINLFMIRLISEMVGD